MYKKNKKNKNMEENTMAAITNDYIYSVTMKKSAQKKIPVMKKSTIEECRRISAKYSKKD